MFDEEDGRQMLPLYDSGDTDVLVLPGEVATRKLTARGSSAVSGTLRPNPELLIVMDSWNGRQVKDLIRHGNCKVGTAESVRLKFRH
mmetsp:Transcript_367/g.1081  ORF Transcript_367/g.1081 Transcript_367/m.1081 type:complete len:87 (+) Transcript_367:1698-1958(+)